MAARKTLDTLKPVLDSRITAPGLPGVAVDEYRDAWVLVMAIDHESEAYAQGLRYFDRIEAIDGRPMTHKADVFDALQSHQPGETVVLDTVRGTWTEERMQITPHVHVVKDYRKEYPNRPDRSV